MKVTNPGKIIADLQADLPALLEDSAYKAARRLTAAMEDCVGDSDAMQKVLQMQIDHVAAMHAAPTGISAMVSKSLTLCNVNDTLRDMSSDLVRAAAELPAYRELAVKLPPRPSYQASADAPRPRGW